MHIVCLEGDKKNQVQTYCKKTQGPILWDAQHFLKGTEFLGLLLTSAEAEAAPCVPGSGLQGLLMAGACISINSPQCPQETSRSAHGVRGDFGSPLVPCRAPRAESASHITLCWVMHEEGGQEVLWYDSYCSLETWAGRVISFPVYLFTSSFPVTVQGTSMFREMYLRKKKACFEGSFLDSLYRPQISAFLIYIYEYFFGSAHFTARYGNFSPGLRREEHRGTMFLHCI